MTKKKEKGNDSRGKAVMNFNGKIGERMTHRTVARFINRFKKTGHAKDHPSRDGNTSDVELTYTFPDVWRLW